MCSDFLYKSIYCEYSFELPQEVYKSIYCGYSYELPQLVEAIQMSTHNICYYKIMGSSLKPTKIA